MSHSNSHFDPNHHKPNPDHLRLMDDSDVKKYNQWLVQRAINRDRRKNAAAMMAFLFAIPFNYIAYLINAPAEVHFGLLGISLIFSIFRKIF